jgi:hypothetical protein
VRQLDRCARSQLSAAPRWTVSRRDRCRRRPLLCSRTPFKSEPSGPWEDDMRSLRSGATMAPWHYVSGPMLLNRTKRHRLKPLRREEMEHEGCQRQGVEAQQAHLTASDCAISVPGAHSCNRTRKRTATLVGIIRSESARMRWRRLCARRTRPIAWSSPNPLAVAS